MHRQKSKTRHISFDMIKERLWIRHVKFLKVRPEEVNLVVNMIKEYLWIRNVMTRGVNLVVLNKAFMGREI